MPVQNSVRPGGFWIRFMAAIIDGLIVAIPSFIVNFAMGLIVAMISRGGSLPMAYTAFQMIISSVIGILISLAYHAYYYQSTGSTLGKKIFQLKVVDNETGNLLTFKQVVLREVVGKILSSLTLMIGYIMAGVRHDKRALHDLIADSKVLEINGL
jgi:uncharacterized RDD family membrane protein YckC